MDVTSLPMIDSVVPLIAEHDTWISCDPILGCPARCAYCYTVPLGLAAAKPVVRTTPQDQIIALTNHLRNRSPGPADRAPTPVAIGNYTDMFMSQAGIDWLCEYLSLHVGAFPELPVCLITKARLTASVIGRLDAFRHPIYLFFSQSFMRWYGGAHYERGSIASPDETAHSIRDASLSLHVIPFHFWRPLCNWTMPSADEAKRQIALMKMAGSRASIAVGLKTGSVGTPLEVFNILGAATAVPAGESIEPTVLARALEAGRELDYPVYRNTSCAIALASCKAELLATWRGPARQQRCVPCYCPPTQRILCDKARASAKSPTSLGLLHVAQQLGLSPEVVLWDNATQAIHVGAELSQEQHATIMHIFGYHVVAARLRRTLAWLGGITEKPA